MGRYFITLEGGEGAGKTTVLHELRKRLSNMGYSVVTTREPGGIEIAEKIREVILNPKNTKMDARTEALLYAAARRQHFVEKIKPALDRDEIVLCDRFIDSSLVYQGYARSLGIDEVLEINQFAIEGYMPSLTLLFDITPEQGLKRIEQNLKREKNRLDLEDIHFHKEVYKGYKIIQEMYPNRIKKINANQSVEEVTAEALEHIVSHLF